MNEQPHAITSVSVIMPTYNSARTLDRAVASVLAQTHAAWELIIVDDACPHDGGRISDGFVDGEHLVCARHGWELEARNGRCERACKLRE